MNFSSGLFTVASLRRSCFYLFACQAARTDAAVGRNPKVGPRAVAQLPTWSKAWPGGERGANSALLKNLDRGASHPGRQVLEQFSLFKTRAPVNTNGDVHPEELLAGWVSTEGKAPLEKFLGGDLLVHEWKFAAAPRFVGDNPAVFVTARYAREPYRLATERVLSHVERQTNGHAIRESNDCRWTFFHSVVKRPRDGILPESFEGSAQLFRFHSFSM